MLEIKSAVACSKLVSRLAKAAEVSAIHTRELWSVCVETCWTQHHLLIARSIALGWLENKLWTGCRFVFCVACFFAKHCFSLSIVVHHALPKFVVALESGSCARPAMAPLPPTTIMVCVQVAPQIVGSATATARAPGKVSAMGVASSQAVVAVSLTTLQLRLQVLRHPQMMQQRQKFQGRHVAGAAWFRPALPGLLRATLQILVSATMRRHGPPFSCICKDWPHHLAVLS